MYTIQDGIGVLDGAPISINTRICQAIEIKKKYFRTSLTEFQF